ncbi:GntR family transcriptional regulator (plasmid) [Agrobacterium vitis]|uniref:GntR family transcriptional regulator n=1 Tax=Agrobacterium vitis TaxID=373 RepID=UPI0012E9318C|nr:GntR family transcriptional regulator [Agrobacterium vitis]MVA27387.1 FCD domain-containing protein [Agrobacterium vitis]
MPRKQTPARAGKLLRTDAYERLLIAIITGEIEAGSRVDEKQLMKQYGLGQAAVRDALFRLDLEGLVERHPRIGTRVAELGLRELQDVYEARLLLESYAAALGAVRGTPEDFAAIRGAFAQHADAVERRDIHKMVEIDWAFHRALARASQNQQIEVALRRLHNNACRFWCFGLKRASSTEMHQQRQYHLDIVDAMEARDMAGIEAAIRKASGYSPDRNFLVGEPSLPFSVHTLMP